MKTSELLKMLRKEGCLLIRNGSSHDILKAGLNFSQLLQEAITEKLHLA